MFRLEKWKKLFDQSQTNTFWIMSNKRLQEQG